MTRRLTGVLMAVASVSCGQLGVDGQGQSRSGLATCPTTPAPQVFENALCLCEDFDEVGSGLVVSSTQGAKANVGVNGAAHLVGRSTVNGSVVAWEGIDGVGRLEATGNVTTTGDVNGVGHLRVGGDLSVGGNLTAVGQLVVEGQAKVKGTMQSVGREQVAGLGAYVAPAAPPCACNGPKLVDVVQEIAKAKAKNDNAKAGLASLDVIGKQDVTLETGTYFFEGVRSIGRTHLTIRGAVALYLDGSLDAVGDEQIILENGAVLDLFVAGGIRHVGNSVLGASGRPGALRLYLGGPDAVMVSVGNNRLRGLVYAPDAPVSLVGNSRLEGALFARRLSAVGRFEIDYAKAALPGSGVCEGPGTPGSAGGGSGSASGGGSGSASGGGSGSASGGGSGSASGGGSGSASGGGSGSASGGGDVN